MILDLPMARILGIENHVCEVQLVPSAFAHLQVFCLQRLLAVFGECYGQSLVTRSDQLITDSSDFRTRIGMLGTSNFGLSGC